MKNKAINIHDYIYKTHDGNWQVKFQKWYGEDLADLITLHESTHRTGWNAVIELTSYCLQNNIKMADYNELEWRRYYSDCDRHLEYMLSKKGKVSEGEWEMAFSCDAPNKPGYYRANND